MRVKSLVIGYAFALALLLFAERHPSSTKPSGFRNVIDLTFPSDAQLAGLMDEGHRGDTRRSQSEETRMEAPASFAAGLWTRRSNSSTAIGCTPGRIRCQEKHKAES